MTYSKRQGFWITSRGGRKSPAECMRIQGISYHPFQGYPEGYIRSCARNSMSARVVSMIINTALEGMKSFKRIHLERAFPATIEASEEVSAVATQGLSKKIKQEKKEFSCSHHLYALAATKKIYFSAPCMQTVLRT